MQFADLMSEADVEAEVLLRETGATIQNVADWTSGAARPPGHIIRSLEMLAKGRSRSKMVPPKRGPTQDREPADRPKLVSLFAGAGGLDIGLETAGFQTVLANEIEPHACESLRANKLLSGMSSGEFDEWFDRIVAPQRCFKSASRETLFAHKQRIRPALTANTRPLASAKVIERDVRLLSAEQVLAETSSRAGDLSLIAGGAPCQPFSRAGKQETVNCDDGRLFLEFVRLVDETRPRWFLFENVKGLVQHRTDVMLSTCRLCHSTRPASFDLRTSCTSSDGAIDACAACRRSVAISPRWEKRKGGSLEIIEAEFSRLGYHCSSAVLNARDFGVPQDRDRLFIVGSRDGERFEWPMPTHGAEEGRSSLFENARTPHVSLRQAILEQGHWRYGGLDERAVLWVKNVVRPHDEPVTWSLDRFAPTVGAHQAAKLAIAPYGVPPEQLARQQWHTLGRRQGDTPPVFVEHEYLTDLELLKLQSFPRHWYLHGTRMERAFQIGNAVPPRLAQSVGEALMRAIAGSVVPRRQAAVA